MPDAARDEIFTTRIVQETDLVAEWLVCRCTIEQNGKRLNRLRLDPALRNEFRWADAIRDKSGMNCTEEI